MPSIFIWKATTSNTSKKMIRIYSGSNWMLEENDNCSNSKSYMYLDQIVIYESNNLLITFHTKNMPQDWVGSDLLEVSDVPYEMIKSDAVGTLEMIGEWMRFTKNDEIDYCIESLKAEYITIKKWISQQSISQQSIIQQSIIQQSIIQQSISQQSINQTTNHNLKHQKSKTIIDPQKVQLNFQEFLIKYSLPANRVNYILTATT